jgi:hypothetical protein
MDEGKTFCVEFHNEIVNFLKDVNAEGSPKKAYEKFIASCQKAAKRQGGVN